MEAANTTKLVLEIERRAHQCAENATKFLVRAVGEIELTQKDYDERAFGPFWDHVASAAVHLATYKLEIESLTSLGEKYSRLLESRQHSFPKMLSVPQNIPDPTHAIKRLGKLVREGQKDFQFAVIWEHHRTRRVLVEGFSTLESTLQALESSLQESFIDFASRFSYAASSSLTALETSVDRGTQHVVDRLKTVEELLDKRRE